jgi:hypothetical protein
VVGPPAAPAEVLDGPGVRRLTRRSAAQRSVTSWRTRLEDAWSTAASAAICLAVLGGWLASVRDDIAARAPVSDTPLPSSVTAVVALVVAVAALVGLLDRLGPISASPAAAAWWLPLPADRRGLLRGDLAGVAGTCALTAAALAAPLSMVWGERSSLVTVAGAAAAAAAVATGLAGAVTLAQTRGRTGRLSTVAGTVAVTVSAAAAVLALTPPLARAAQGLTAGGLPGLSPSAVVPLGAAALVVLVAADRGLGRIRSDSLRSLGATSSYASASVFSMDARELGRAFARTPRRPPRRTRGFRRVRQAWQAIAVADLVLLARSPWQAGQLVVATAVPVLAIRTEGLDRLPAAGATGLLLGWLLAAIAAGHPGRQGQATPALDRLLPLSPGHLVAARCIAPALILTVVCGVSGLLLGQGSGNVLAWTALAVATVPTWVAAALRGAYRPELDWSGPVIATPMGVVPAGIGATLGQGIDVGIVGCLPVVGAVLLGGPPSGLLVAGQLMWSGCLAVAALVHLAHRKAAPGS